MTPDPAALAVLLDAARAAYGDDDERVRWLAHPDAVREAMDVPMFDHADGSLYCQGCRTSLYMHLRDEARPCDRLRALDAIDHPRGHEAVALAWEQGSRQAPWWIRFEVAGPGESLEALTARYERWVEDLRERMAYTAAADLMRVSCDALTGRIWSEAIPVVPVSD